MAPIRNSRARARAWCITLNNPTEDDLEKYRTFPWRAEAAHFVAQLEAGDGGTPHLQAYVYWRSAKTMRATKERFGDRCHVEKARGTKQANFVYCTKPDGRLDGPWYFGFPRPRRLPTEWRPWQTHATQLATAEPDDRTIYWIWEPTGGTGKSKLQLYWTQLFNAVLVNGNARDAKCGIKALWGKDSPTGPPEQPVIMVNLPRNTQKPELWNTLEQLKDGIFFSGKYEPAMVTLPELHVFVFANEPPEQCSLSIDKLRVYRIDESTMVMRPDRWTLPFGQGQLYGPGF